MKILIPIFAFAVSGGGRVLSEFATRIKARGHEVAFLCFADSGAPYFPTTADIIWVDYYGQKRLSNDLKRTDYPLKYFFVRKKFQRVIERYGHGYDVILATHSLTALPVFRAQIAARKFYYIQAYETEYYEEHFKHLPYKLAVDASYKLNLNRIVNCELYLDYKGIKATKFVYPGINGEIFYPKEIVKSGNSEVFAMGCIGRTSKVKGTHLVIDAFHILRDKFPTIELHIAFGSPELASIPGIKIFKPSNDNELANFYRSVDVLIAPGTVQLGAIHYPVLEAFACGTPVVTTGYSHANRENAYIVPINDAGEIAESVVEILKNPEVAAKKVEMAKEIVPAFIWEKVTTKMISCLQER